MWAASPHPPSVAQQLVLLQHRAALPPRPASRPHLDQSQQVGTVLGTRGADAERGHFRRRFPLRPPRLTSPRCVNRRSSCFFIRVPGAAATCGQSGCEHVPATFGCWWSRFLPLLPRLGECKVYPRPPHLKTSSPRLPHHQPIEAPAVLALSQWPRPSTECCPGLPATAAAVSWLALPPPSPLVRVRRRLAGLGGGAAGGDPGGSPWAAGPALRDPRHRRPCLYRRRLPRDLENRARRCLQLGALPAGAPCKGRGAALAVERGAAMGAVRALLWAEREKEPRCLRETRSSDPYPSRGAGECV